MGPHIKESLQFQTGQGYEALKRARESFTLLDGEFALALYESIESNLAALMRIEQAGVPNSFCMEDYQIPDFRRSKYEPFVLETLVGLRIGKGIVRANEKRDPEVYGLPSLTLDSEGANIVGIGLSRKLGHLSKSYQDGSFRTADFTYRRIWWDVANHGFTFRGHGDCSEAREMVRVLDLIPKIREKYA